MPPAIPPDIQPYLDQASHNFRAYEAFRQTFPDWAASALFYSALQLVDAHAVRQQEPVFLNHRERQAYVRAESSGLWRHYRRLEDVSRAARYLHQVPADADFPKLLHEFGTIVRHMASFGIVVHYPPVGPG